MLYTALDPNATPTLSPMTRPSPHMSATVHAAANAAANAADRVRMAWRDPAHPSPPDLASLFTEFDLANDGIAAEAVIADAEERWTRALPATLEHYSASLPSLVARPRIRRALLMCEAARRIHEPESTLRSALSSRFPTLNDDLDSVLSILSLMRASADAASPSDPAPPLAPETRLGKYTLITPLGRGSFGEVWRARDELLNRQVALKVLDRPAESPRDDDLTDDTRRLLAEARAAASLDHPHIIPVHDAGVFPEIDRLYIDYHLATAHDPRTPALPLDRLVTETRNGRPFDAHTAARLIEPIARAIAHAHARGILHRDIKPSNILLAPSDDSTAALRPLITDFGLATAIDAHTPSSRLAGTPAYMSPAQARISPATITTPTPLDDVFSLGATLIFLLTARHPRSPGGRYSPDPVQDVLEQARRAELDRPTSAPSSFNTRPLPHTLVEIANRATAANPLDRYQSADLFAADLRAWLDHRPTTARALSPVSTLALWARRNAPVVIVGLIALTTLSLGTTLHLRRITTERDLAIAARFAANTALADALAARDNAAGATKFLQDMLAVPQPAGQVATRDLRISDVLIAAARNASKLNDQPLVEASIRHTIGTTYLALTRAADAEPHLARAVELRTELLGPENVDTIQSRTKLASALHLRGRTREAIAELTALLDTATTALGPDHRETCIIHNTLGTLHLLLNQVDLAEFHQRRALEGRTRTLGADHLETLGARRALASVLVARRKFAEASTELRTLLENLEARPSDEGGGPNSFFYAVTLQDFGVTLRQLKEVDEAESIFRRAIDRLRILAGPDQQNTLTAEHNLAVLLLRDRQDPASALPLAQHSADSAARVLSPDNTVTIAFRRVLGECFIALGRIEEARTTLTVAADSARRTFGPDRTETRELQSLLNKLPKSK